VSIPNGNQFKDKNCKRPRWVYHPGIGFPPFDLTRSKTYKVVLFFGMQNESAITFALFSSTLGTTKQDGPRSAWQLWDRTRRQMLHGTGQVILQEVDWISDFWLARGSRITAGILAPTWNPPTSLEDWPGDGEATTAAVGLPSRCTNGRALLALFQQESSRQDSYDPTALPEFLQSEAAIQSHGDSRMVFGEHVRAWLSTSVGHLMQGILLSPSLESPEYAIAAFQRFQWPLQINLPNMWIPEFEDRRIELLYNLKVSSEGKLLHSDIRSGQSESWREHWDWLSCDIEMPEALQAVRLAARLLRNPAILIAIAECFSTENSYLQLVSLAVVRRCLLTLKAMTWLELALTHEWEFARPQDLCCFAFNAIKPEWPRRLLGISHRSADVKRTLMGMKLWNSSRCAIDANYVPSWETNTGMMWGLFAALPVIARIESPHYRYSIWCRREIEITDYLLENSDFLSSRWLLDVPAAELPSLDTASTAWDLQDDNPSGITLLTSFPPSSTVWSPRAMPEWEVKLLRAAGALRIMNVFLSDPEVTNFLADQLYSGLELPDRGAPTNNPDGWKAYAAIFRELGSILPNKPFHLPIHLPARYGPADRIVDAGLAQRIPDLSNVIYHLRDIVVAIEWLHTTWPVMVDQKRGDLLAINCQTLTAELWSTKEEVSLHRGLACIRTPGPLWFLQLAGQEVENWPLVGERPIFTEHTKDQFAWMMEAWFEPRESQSRYPVDCGLDLSPELVECIRKLAGGV
jgi:hypothetical protein